MSIDRVIALYDGFHHEGEIRMMNRRGAEISEGVIVSIGSYRGQMDCALALHAHVPVYAIDNREGSASDPFPFGEEDRVAWMENVLAMGLGAKIRPINLSSEQVAWTWDQPVGMLWIDGSHDYDSVRNDLANWLHFMVPEGLVALHDVTNPDTPGVAQAIDYFEHSLELIEQADLTCVYRVRPGFYIKASDGSVAIPAYGEGSDVEVLMGTPIKMYVDDAADYIVAKAEPVHPSQRSKTPVKKPTARKPAKKVVKRK